jgi:hypothetical protein
MKRYYGVISLVIICVALALRLYHFSARAPFDWDQNRDYSAISQIASGKLTLIGPVAKGEGGFFLGPLYYYLATPIYLLMHGSPRALPLTSIFIDVATVATILALARKRLGDLKTLGVAFLWSMSWFAIEMSRISWNVSLIPLWSLLIMWFLSEEKPLALTKGLTLGIVAGLSWHIHAALIPLTGVLLLLYWKKWVASVGHITMMIVGYLIPLIPLIIFDLRHAGLNWYLISQMVSDRSGIAVPAGTLWTAIIERLGKNTQSLLFGISAYSLLWGYVTIALAAVGIWMGRGVTRLCGVILFLNLVAVWVLQEVGFPEYYFAASYLATLILVASAFMRLTRGHPSLAVIICLILAGLSLKQYTVQEISFALSRKEEVAKHIAGMGGSVDLEFHLSPGREGGIKPFLSLAGGVIDPDSPTKILVSDQPEGPLVIEGELAEIIGQYGGMRIAKVVVE